LKRSTRILDANDVGASGWLKKSAEKSKPVGANEQEVVKVTDSLDIQENLFSKNRDGKDSDKIRKKLIFKTGDGDSSIIDIKNREIYLHSSPS
jgi:hypothetical protein